MFSSMILPSEIICKIMQVILNAHLVRYFPLPVMFDDTVAVGPLGYVARPVQAAEDLAKKLAEEKVLRGVRGAETRRLTSEENITR